MFKKDKISEKELTAQTNFLSQSTNLEGNIECNNKFFSSETSKIEGNLFAVNAEISGEVIGDIEVKELLSLKSTSKINGNIKSSKLLVEPGAIVNGNFKTFNKLDSVEPSNNIKKPSESIVA